MKKWLPALLSLALLASCKKEEIDYDQRDREIIQKYIADNNLNAQSTASGLYYVIEQEGTGARPTAQSDVKVVYKGYFTNGGVFDQSDATGVEFNLSGVIAGWREGIPFFREGGKGILLIPSKLAYGSQGRGDIDPNTVIIFDIHLLKVY